MRVQPQPAGGYPVYSVNEEQAPSPGSKYATVGTFGYFGTMILYCIPIIGWLACIIAAFTSKNINRRNFARAMLIFLIIGAVVAVGLYFVISWVFEALLDAAKGYVGDVSSEFNGLTDIFDLLNGGGPPVGK
jgi:amino acid transporter